MPLPLPLRLSIDALTAHFDLGALPLSPLPIALAAFLLLGVGVRLCATAGRGRRRGGARLRHRALAALLILALLADPRYPLLALLAGAVGLLGLALLGDVPARPRPPRPSDWRRGSVVAPAGACPGLVERPLARLGVAVACAALLGLSGGRLLTGGGQSPVADAAGTIQTGVPEAWGADSAGQLGLGDLKTSPTPLQIHGLPRITIVACHFAA
ncbi:MAG: hypothetical protein NVSMB23_29700 [Myxococcales bacterium]